jgi:hypothetical protein
MNKRKRNMLSRDRGEINVTREAGYIISKAQEHDSRVVKFGSIVLFSTQTGDAWMLDLEDHFALCLARDGVKQEYAVVDTASNFQIDWNAEYEIRDEMFIVYTSDGGGRAIFGYPTREIIQASKFQT